MSLVILRTSKVLLYLHIALQAIPRYGDDDKAKSRTVKTKPQPPSRPSLLGTKAWFDDRSQSPDESSLVDRSRGTDVYDYSDEDEQVQQFF